MGVSSGAVKPRRTLFPWIANTVNRMLLPMITSSPCLRLSTNIVSLLCRTVFIHRSGLVSLLDKTSRQEVAFAPFASHDNSFVEWKVTQDHGKTGCVDRVKNRCIEM